MGRIWFHARSAPGPFAASFVTLAHFYACLALPNVFGSCRVSRSHKTATKLAKNMFFSTSLSSRAEAEHHIFGPFFTLLWSQASSLLRLFGTHGLSKTTQNRPQNRLTTHPHAPQWSWVISEKIIFDRFWTHFGPISGGHGQPKTPQNAAKQAPGGQNPLVAVCLGLCGFWGHSEG